MVKVGQVGNLFYKAPFLSGMADAIYHNAGDKNRGLSPAAQRQGRGAAV